MSFAQAPVSIRHPIATLAFGLCIASVLAACAGGSGNTTPAASTAGVTALQAAPLTVTIRIPAATEVASSSSRSPKYISTAIASINFRLTGVTPTGGGTFAGALNTDTLVQLSYGSGNCTLVATVETCSATFVAPAPATDTWTISTYATATPVVGTTMPLSIYKGYTLATTLAGPNDAVVATSGVPNSLVFSPASANNVVDDVALVGVSALTTSLSVVDAGGATIVGSQAFADANGNAESVSFTGCDTHLTPTPASFTALSPAALGTGTIGIAYDGLLAVAGTLHCYASTSELTAQYSVNVIAAATPSPAPTINPAFITLGNAATFAVLANQAVTAGAVAVTGDIGISPGNAITGFPPATVSGALQLATVAAQQAQAALSTAYGAILAQSGTPTAISGDIGGQTLLPGLYAAPSSLAISSGTLTLNGNGDPNAVFVFRIASTLTTTTGGGITLINGANAANIFWQVGSSATLNGTPFAGNVLAFTSITIGTGVVMTGRALAEGGSVTIGSGSITVPTATANGQARSRRR
jgi:hypothetical protein